MIQVFVQADDVDGSPHVAGHYLFAVVPRVGEHVVVDNGTEKNVLLRVISVTHLSESADEEEMNPISYVQLKCEIAD